MFSNDRLLIIIILMMSGASFVSIFKHNISGDFFENFIASGVRDTGLAHKINKKTVINTLKSFNSLFLVYFQYDLPLKNIK